MLTSKNKNQGTTNVYYHIGIIISDYIAIYRNTYISSLFLKEGNRMIPGFETKSWS